jgi:hypothetical protein
MIGFGLDDVPCANELFEKVTTRQNYSAGIIAITSVLKVTYAGHRQSSCSKAQQEEKWHRRQDHQIHDFSSKNK